MNANVTYFPIQYKSDKSALSPESQHCYTPQISLPLLRKHIDEMSAQGWSLVSIQSIPRIEYRDDHAFSVPSGFMLFWQRDPGSSLEFAPPLATGAVLNEQLFTPSPVVHRESRENVKPLAEVSAFAPGAALPPASLPLDVFSSANESLTDLNQKYRIRSARPAPGQSTNLGDAVPKEQVQMTVGIQDHERRPERAGQMPEERGMPAPGQGGFGASRQTSPVPAMPSPEVRDSRGKGVTQGIGAGPARSILADETTDFDPNDPLVHEIAALRKAMVEQTQTQTHTTQIVHKTDLIFDKINRE